MSTAISFLESLGRNAALRYADKDEIEVAAVNASLAPAARAAILSADRDSIAAVLGRPIAICCAVFPGKEDDESEEPSRDDDEEIRARGDTVAS